MSYGGERLGTDFGVGVRIGVVKRTLGQFLVMRPAGCGEKD